jgi:hypothetical protein
MREKTMRRCVLLTVSMVIAGSTLAAVADPIRIELNALESTDAGCRLSFVIENKNARALEALRADLAVFNRGGAVQRRMLVDLGPVRQAKTIIKSFVTEQKCDEVGSVLINDVSLCTPLDRDACIDALDLASRIEAVRLYK